MPRILLALLAATGLAAPVAAQPPAVSLSPGGSNGPAMPAGIGPVVARPGQPGVVYFTAIAPWGWATGWGYQTYDPRTGYGYAFGGYLPEGTARPVAAAVEPAQKPAPYVALANEFPATLSVQFPAAAKVWLNGATASGRETEERVFTSPVLKPGQQYTFEVKARWSNRGKTYEATRTVALGSGDRSRLLIVSGSEVQE